VNRRVAEHQNRKGASALDSETIAEAQHNPGRRASDAAARVAARFASAPSYSEVLADEARAAVRAAEAASQAALESQAAAEMVLASLEAAHIIEPVRETLCEPVREPQRETDLFAVPPSAAGVHACAAQWEADLPARPAEPPPAQPGAETERLAVYEIPVEPWRGEAQAESSDAGVVAEHDLQMHANLIEFPREVVAPHKLRPRLAEGPLAADEPAGLLSIYEVDPATISTMPAVTERVAAQMDAEAEPVVAGAEWSGIKLDAQPVEEFLEDAVPAVGAPPALQLAPLSLRLMAVVVDGALITGAFLAASMVAASNAQELPALREIEVGSALALAGIALLYQAIFFTLARATPGMKYAHLSLRTFEDRIPTLEQRCTRLGSLVLSVLPVGLGVMWAVFDEEHLSWHDRLSRTYVLKDSWSRE